MKEFCPGKNLLLEIIHNDKEKDIIDVCHTYNDNQIKWFKAGSSLNLIASNQ